MRVGRGGGVACGVWMCRPLRPASQGGRDGAGGGGGGEGAACGVWMCMPMCLVHHQWWIAGLSLDLELSFVALVGGADDGGFLWVLRFPCFCVS